jgi:hypothetical protein
MYLKNTLPIVTLVLLAVVLISFPSKGASFPGEGVDASLVGYTQPTFILTENANNKVLRLWSIPSQDISVLYDQWNIIIQGNLNDTYKVKINAIERYNGTMEHRSINLTFDASRINTARVTVQINNRTYLFDKIIVNHQFIGVEGVDMFGEEKSFTKSDINRASLRSAFGVVLACIVTIPIIWKGVKLWRNKQGVNQW